LFAPGSESQASLGVTPPSSLRSMPEAPFEKIELPRTALLTPPKIFTPLPALFAMVLPAPGTVPPMRLIIALPRVRTPPPLFPTAPVPVTSVPMKLPCMVLSLA